MIYQTAFAHGRSVLEIDPDGAAAAEVRQLFEEVWRRLGGQIRAPMRTANDDQRRPAARASMGYLS
jgi:Flp pilus assembly CpaE family ATPase